MPQCVHTLASLGGRFRARITSLSDPLGTIVSLNECSTGASSVEVLTRIESRSSARNFAKTDGCCCVEEGARRDVDERKYSSDAVRGRRRGTLLAGRPERG